MVTTTPTPPAPPPAPLLLFWKDGTATDPNEEWSEAKYEDYNLFVSGWPGEKWYWSLDDGHAFVGLHCESQCDSKEDAFAEVVELLQFFLERRRRKVT